MDEAVARAGMFQGLESAVAAVIKQLQPVDFARRRTVFAEGEPADSPQVPDDASGLAVDPRIPDRIRANRVALANQILTQASVCSASVTTARQTREALPSAGRRLRRPNCAEVRRAHRRRARL